jgi:hypothetical protein
MRAVGGGRRHELFLSGARLERGQAALDEFVRRGLRVDELIELSFERVEPEVKLVEPVIDAVEPAVNAVEAPVNTVELFVSALELSVDAVQTPSDGLEAVPHLGRQPVEVPITP